MKTYHCINHYSKCRLFLIFSLILIIPTISISQNTTLNYIDVSPHVIMLHIEKTEGSNITCIALDEGLVFIDCSLFTEIAAKFRSDMEKRFNKKTIALILTHAHTDHFFGMGAFKDVNVLASSKSKEYFNFQFGINFSEHLKTYKGVFPRFEEALKTSDIFSPLIWFDKEIQIGNQENYIIIKHTGGHSIGSSYIYYPTEKVIVAGDNLQVDYHPYFGDRTGDMTQWIDALKSWEKLDPIKICPGHGKPVNLTYLSKTKLYFEQLMSVLEDLKSQNIKIEEVIKHKNLPQGYWPADLKKPGWWDFSIGVIYNRIKPN